MSNDSYRFRLGQFSCLAIDDADGGDVSCNCLLVQTGEHRVLIDTGSGGTMPSPGRLVPQLRAAGISPDEIDVVAFSHADTDHIGGAADDLGNVTFPRARHVLSRAEWDYWAAKPQRLRPNELLDEAFHRWANTIPPTRLSHLGAHLEHVEPGAEIVPGLRAIAVPGHTPGMLAFAVTSDAEELLFIGDVLYPDDLGQGVGDSSTFLITPAVVHEWFDMDVAQAATTREYLFAQAASKQRLLMAYHVAFPGLGYVMQNTSGWQWTTFSTRR
jgi:glyoxylase-like metal-dependent hydrolase (beta-lactamase superfamily II)